MKATFAILALACGLAAAQQVTANHKTMIATARVEISSKHR